MVNRFIIGRGELLTFDIPPPKIKPSKDYPYTFDQAKQQLMPQLEQMISVLNKVPEDACPGGTVVMKVDLHPAFIAKSFFPADFLRSAGLTHIGSRTIRLKPRKDLRKTPRDACETTQLFVAGTRFAVERLPAFVDALSEGETEATQFSQIENVSAMQADDRIRGEIEQATTFEVGLHAWPDRSARKLLASFEAYATNLGFEVNTDYVFPVGRMLFVGARGRAARVPRLAQYSLVRSIGPMPGMRRLRPMGKGMSVELPVNVPTAAPVSDEPRVAVLDGGLPRQHALGRFIRNYQCSDPKADDVPEYLEHGLGVTSALLFGPLSTTQEAARPYAYVDHFRVLDQASDVEDPFELYRTLAHVEEVLLSGGYQFVNLSVGPESPLDDSDLHTWTATLDRILADGNILLTVAAGNNGRADPDDGLNRILVPADSVNAMTVGAADRSDSSWKRARYSAVGPGRNPGRRKPDVVSFGGSTSEYFHVTSAGRRPEMVAVMGTSYSAPAVLRTGVGIRAVLGEDVHPLTIKALLIHSATRRDSDDPNEVGWGRIPNDVNEIILCGNGMARIIYQGVLRPGKYLRAPLPLPAAQLVGKVHITATFCYATPVDAEDSGAYTKAGLSVKFRPHADKHEITEVKGKHVRSTSAKPASFFSSTEYRTEKEQRADLGKWETVLHASVSKLGRSLKESTFDIHYNARSGGGPAGSGAELLRYALVVTVEAPSHADLYEDILATHSQLRAIEPRISLPLRTNA